MEKLMFPTTLGDLESRHTGGPFRIIQFKRGLFQNYIMYQASQHISLEYYLIVVMVAHLLGCSTSPAGDGIAPLQPHHLSPGSGDG
ncbi:hypothetical protein BS78_05G170200 [Paspalum vaginatum]|nr:hypothetical protein BS78_05G170200 [Paspalum vaginatum]